MIRTIWGDPERFKKSYFPAKKFKRQVLPGRRRCHPRRRHGYFTITGRIDDVLNVSGHRLGTMEIESALVSQPELVAEAAVVGRPDDLTGEAICAFVVLKRPRPTGEEAKPAIANELRNHGWPRRSAPSPSPRTSASATTCPRPARGKIMRRLLRSALPRERRSRRIPRTLENPAILEQLASGLLIPEVSPFPKCKGPQ